MIDQCRMNIEHAVVGYSHVFERNSTNKQIPFIVNNEAFMRFKMLAQEAIMTTITKKLSIAVIDSEKRAEKSSISSFLLFH